jgi:hypothetical protein
LALALAFNDVLLAQPDQSALRYTPPVELMLCGVVNGFDHVTKPVLVTVTLTFCVAPVHQEELGGAIVPHTQFQFGMVVVAVSAVPDPPQVLYGVTVMLPLTGIGEPVTEPTLTITLVDVVPVKVLEPNVPPVPLFTPVMVHPLGKVQL